MHYTSLLPCPFPPQADEYEDMGEYELGRGRQDLLSRHMARSMRSAVRALTGSMDSSRGDEFLDTDEVSKQLLRQFGEVVLRHELPKPPTMTLRKAEDAKMKVRMKMQKQKHNARCAPYPWLAELCACKHFMYAVHG